MKKLIFLISLIVSALIGKAQYDITLSNQFNGTLILPGTTPYIIGKQNGGFFYMKPNNYQTGQVGWVTPCNGAPFIDSLITCGAGSYGVDYKKNDNTWSHLDIYIRYFVDIIDSTPGTTTYGQTPDTIWIPQGGTANLSAGSNFALNLWFVLGAGSEFSSNNTVNVSHGTYVAGCSDGDYTSYDTIVVAEACIPSTVTIDTAICETQMIFAQGAWQNTAGTYHDTLTNTSGCDSIITTHLTILSRPALFVVHPTQVCMGDTITLTATGADTYLWWNNETNDTTTVIANTAGISYFSIVGYNNNGCSISITDVPVTVNPLPTVHFTVDTITVGSIQNVTLTPTINNADSYLWNTTETTPTIVTNVLGWHYVTVTNGCGFAVDSILIRLGTNVPENTDSSEIAVKICPNPTTDFIELSAYKLVIEKAEVFNQIGQLVLQVVDNSNLRSINVSMLPQGVYYLKLDAHNGTAKPIRFLKE